jgi:tetratricopeptide (TPR) repeat protein
VRKQIEITSNSFFHQGYMLLLKWLDRGKIVLLIGSLVLIFGARFPWYNLPAEVLDHFGANLVFANGCRLLSLCLGILGLVFTFLLGIQRISRPVRLVIWGSFVFALLFPYFITVWSPTAAFIASSYYTQGTRVRVNIESNFPEIQSQWKQNITLADTSPLNSISDFLIRDSRFFQMSSWDQVLVEGLGYTNSFFWFIGRGWVYTVIGLVFALFGVYLYPDKKRLDALISDLGKLLPWLGMFAVTLIFSLIAPIVADHNLDALFTKGDYQQVLSSSERLASVYPPFSGDKEFLKRWGEASYYANQPNPTLVAFTQGLEQYFARDFAKAETYFRQALASSPQQFLVRGFLATTLIKQGINYFNAQADNVSDRKPSSAAQKFEEALQIFPYNVEALYDLMIARVVNGELEKSAIVAKQVIESQKYFQQPVLGLMGQAYLHSSWASYQNDHLKAAWRQYRQSVDTSAWKDTESSELTDGQFSSGDE